MKHKKKLPTMRNNLMYGNDLSIADEELIKKMRDFVNEDPFQND